MTVLHGEGVRIAAFGAAAPGWLRDRLPVGCCPRVGVDELEVVSDAHRERTIGVGLVADDVVLREHALLYFHLGHQRDLRPRLGVAVPMSDQGVAGLVNALTWALSAARGGANVVQNCDVVDHAQAAKHSYGSAAKVAEVLTLAQAAVEELRGAFPEITAVFGTGFPFYCIDSGPEPQAIFEVPESISTFIEVQAEWFANKLVPSRAVGSDVLNVASLLELGADPGQSVYSAFEYTRWDGDPPVPPDSGTLADYLAATTLEDPRGLWPCDVCTTIHNQARFPRQGWIRDFMSSCVECGQTAFLPRAVGVLASDLDLVVLADVAPDERRSLATRVGAWIDGRPSSFRHDTDWAQQLSSPIGPLDVFTVIEADFWDALDAVASSRTWMEVTVRCDVGWLPVTSIDYEVGKFFPLCMEPLWMEGEAAQARLASTRKGFATRVGPPDIVAAYSEDSFYLRQLASNRSVQEVLQLRAGLWTGTAGSLNRHGGSR